VPSVKPTFGSLEDLWRTDSEAKTYCSSVCSAPAMCRSGQEGVAGPTPEIPGMIVAESSRRKKMRSAAAQGAMALLVSGGHSEGGVLIMCASYTVHLRCAAFFCSPGSTVPLTQWLLEQPRMGSGRDLD